MNAAGRPEGAGHGIANLAAVADRKPSSKELPRMLGAGPIFVLITLHYSATRYATGGRF